MEKEYHSLDDSIILNLKELTESCVSVSTGEPPDITILKAPPNFLNGSLSTIFADPNLSLVCPPTGMSSEQMWAVTNSVEGKLGKIIRLLSLFNDRDEQKKRDRELEQDRGHEMTRQIVSEWMSSLQQKVIDLEEKSKGSW
jgi:hypothetical protein